MDVHGHAARVQRKLGDPARTPTQGGVGLRRAIGGIDADGGRGACAAMRLPDDVEQAGVHLDDGVVTPVAQEMVELIEDGGVVGAVDPECGGDRFAGVGVVQVEGAGVAIGDGGLRGGRGHRHKDGGGGY